MTAAAVTIGLVAFAVWFAAEYRFWWSPWAAMAVLVAVVTAWTVFGAARAAHCEEVYDNMDVRGMLKAEEIRRGHDPEVFKNDDVRSSERNAHAARPPRQAISRGSNLPESEKAAGLARCVRRIKRTRAYLEAEWSGGRRGRQNMSSAWHSELDKCREEWS